MIKAEVRPIEECLPNSKPTKYFGVFVGEREIGRTKLQCDAQMALNAINEMVDHNVSSAEQAAYQDGYDMGWHAAVRFVTAGERDE
jgi:hypothetical protein